MDQHDDTDLKEAPRLTDSLTQSQHHNTPERAGGWVRRVWYKSVQGYPAGPYDLDDDESRPQHQSLTAVIASSIDATPCIADGRFSKFASSCPLTYFILEDCEIYKDNFVLNGCYTSYTFSILSSFPLSAARYILLVEQDRRDAYLGNSIAFVTSKGVARRRNLSIV